MVVDGHWEAKREPLGIWLVLVALVLGLIWRLMYFPLWTVEQGLGMRILLSLITAQPLQFVLERTGPAGAIIGALGAILLESKRHDLAHGPGVLWTRERLAIVSAVLAAALFLASLTAIGGAGVAEGFRIGSVTGVIVISLGLYLFWTAERVIGTSMRRLGLVALVLAVLAAGLNFLSSILLFGPGDHFPSALPLLTSADALLGSVSLGFWIMIYSVIVRRNRLLPSATPIAGEA